MNQQEYLKEIDRVIKKGPFSDNWASLSGYKEPEWYKNAKFGIFIHWGVYSVPAFSNEWYPRDMYLKDSAAYEHHLKTYGSHDKFGYKDFIPMFKAEKFNADEWLDLFVQAGAKYMMPVGEHHDGFQMYQSDLSRWNTCEMGPKRDILGELKEAAEKRGVVFCTSSHRAEHYWYYGEGKKIPSDVNDPAYADLYGECADGVRDGLNSLYVDQYIPEREHLENWLARTCELVDKYRPQAVYFDWWIHNLGFKPYLKKFAAYYYNRAAEWDVEVAIDYKHEAFAYKTAIFDVERGQLDAIHPQLWQTDTTMGTKSWGYITDNEYKKPQDLVCDLVDVVSKNGCMLLNVGPKADGTIVEREKEILLSIGKWLRKNGEGIYGSTFWEVYGEGPVHAIKGTFTDEKRPPYTSEDIRYTYKNGFVYAFVMRYPKDGVIKLTKFKWNRDYAGDFDILNVSLLGGEDCASFTRDEQALRVQIAPGEGDGYPICVKIEID